jgi:hypothetical protein
MGGAHNTHDRYEKYNILTPKPEGKRLLRRPRCRWEDNMQVDLKMVGERELDSSVRFEVH